MIRVNDQICIFPEQQRMVVKLPDEQVYAATRLPGAYIQGSLALIPWNEESCRLLENLGLPAVEAAPFHFNGTHLVEGKYTPMRHQMMTAAFMTLFPRCYVLSDPRTGKTGSLILGADYLQRTGMMGGAWLIVTTVTTIHSVWKDSIEKTLGDVRIGVAHGPKRNTIFDTPHDFIITNYDSCRLSKDVILDAIASGYVQGLIIDELTHVGNASSQRHKALAAMANHPKMKYVVGATGTPGSDPQAVYGMCRVVNPSQLPCKTQAAWLDLTTFRWGSEPFQRSLASGAPQVFHRAMQPAIRFNKADILDLPPVTIQDRRAEITAEQRKHLLELRRDAVTIMQSGEAVTAANGGVLLGKMLQIAQGFAISEDGKPVPLDHAPRTAAIIDAISESKAKTVVFGTYKFGNKKLAEELKAAGITVEVVDGSITGQTRGDILRRFQEEEDPQVLICHPTTTAYGVELSAADTMIFNGAPMLGDFVFGQALERLSSAKQRAKSISVIRLSATPEESKLFASLDKGQQQGSFIQSLFEQYAKGDVDAY